MKNSFPAVTGILLFLFSLAACEGVVKTDPSPGDSDYIPPDWTDPVLAYDLEDYFPSRVADYRQAPGQWSQSDVYAIESNLEKLLGPPSGAGIYGADNSSIVSLGMAGGYVVFEFDTPIEDHPDNIGGYEFIIYGNSFWQGGSAESPAREPGVVEVMTDENGNGEADDSWYLIPGSHLTGADSTALDVEYSLEWSEEDSDLLRWSAGGGTVSGEKSFSGSQPWWSESAPASVSFSSVRLLPDECFESGLVFSQVWGYADSAPTSVLGDFNGDTDTLDEGDYPGIEPAWFYTVPDTHGDSEVEDGTGGGAAIDIAWAVDDDFTPAGLSEVSWIKISSASLSVNDSLGEYSCEVDAVARVRRE